MTLFHTLLKIKAIVRFFTMTVKAVNNTQAVIGIKQKYGKNAILRGMNLQEGATARQRNGQVGGHKA